MKRIYPVQFAAYCFKSFGRVKGTEVMASDEAYMVWERFHIIELKK